MNAEERIKEKSFELIERVSIDNLTVAQICDYCGVSKRCFYNYFRDKHELVQRIFTDMSKHCWSSSNPNYRIRDSIEELSSFVFSHKNFFKNTLCYTGQNCLREIMKQQSIENMRAICENKSENGFTLELQIASLFYIEGSLGLLSDVLQGALNPAEYAATHDYMLDYTPEILKQFFY